MPRTKKIDVVTEALTATHESRGIDFKLGFDPAVGRDWCELLKDIFAFANSGGGTVIIGVDGAGVPIKGGAEALLTVDPADVGNKIRSYSGSDFDDFEILPANKSGVRVAVLKVGSAPVPLIPIRPGTYEKERAKQVTAFSVGVVYVRHGAKSEPATSADVARFIELRVRERRRAWLTGIRKVTTAPPNAVIRVERPVVSSADFKAAPVRLTLDPSAPASALPDYDRTHPYRMTELLKVLNARIDDTGMRMTAPSVRTVLQAHGLQEDVSYTWKSRHGTRQYTEAFVGWLEERLRKDHHLIAKARNKLRRERPPPRGGR